MNLANGGESRWWLSKIICKIARSTGSDVSSTGVRTCWFLSECIHLLGPWCTTMERGVSLLFVGFQCGKASLLSEVRNVQLCGITPVTLPFLTSNLTPQAKEHWGRASESPETFNCFSSAVRAGHNTRHSTGIKCVSERCVLKCMRCVCMKCVVRYVCDVRCV